MTLDPPDAANTRITVVIPTYNRATLLRRSLDSLAHQSIDPEQYEVVVVDDGSTDDTLKVCADLSASLDVRALSIPHGGISAAKNAGLTAAVAPIVLFFDDDDVADRDLLGEHLRTHDDHPDERVAVLGYTTWHPSLEVTPFMHWLTNVGQFLFSYGGLAPGARLPFSYWWGGRSSCKKALLLQHGRFDERFRFIVEDIELAFRLSRHGLSVVFNRHAISYMVRPIALDEYLIRCERSGRHLALFSSIHDDPAALEHCRSMNVMVPWDDGWLSGLRDRTTQLESELGSKPDRDGGSEVLHELWDCYWWILTCTTARAYARAGGAGAAQSSSLADGAERIRAVHRRAGQLAGALHEVRALLPERDAAIIALQQELLEKIETCNEVIRGLQRELQKTVGERDATIVALQAELHDKVSACNTIIHDLQQELQDKVGDRDRTILALRAEMFEKIEQRDKEIRRLQREVDEKRRR